MQNHWPGGKNPNKKGKGQKSKKSDSSGKKKADKKVKGKEKAPASANVLTVPDLADLSIQMAQSIDFSCYKMSEKVEWCLDGGCTDHIIPSKSNFVTTRTHFIRTLPFFLPTLTPPCFIFLTLVTHHSHTYSTLFHISHTCDSSFPHLLHPVSYFPHL